MAAVVLRSGGLSYCCCCKNFLIRSPPRIFAGSISTFATGSNKLYSFHKQKANLQSLSSFSSRNQSEPILAVADNASIKSDDKVSSVFDTLDSTGIEASIRDAAASLDIRVGRILRAWRHSEADSLYVEEVDIGEPEPRTICSGLVNYIRLDEVQEMEVIVLANLKPRNMRGVKSNGMLLAASDARHEKVELLLPPEGSVPGERIWFGLEEENGNAISAATPNQVHKKKIWELVQPHLKTSSSCIAVLGDLPMRTSAGLVTCRSLQNANIA
ncbi:hypothetical protein Sjap_026561 [Stephania japonica]|uniref:tRNA-binding domain-containing protein n=1 Tax=Stephania japonica TaxID=461633 RepID=A0AAP0E6D0_9MAGN